MDKCREEFEKTRTFKEFNARPPVVFSNFGGYVSAEDGRPQVYLNGALASWQEQQKRIDELQVRVHAQKKHIKTALIAVEDIHKSAMNEFHEWDVLKEKVPKLCEHLQNLSVAVGELEEALKGGEV